MTSKSHDSHTPQKADCNPLLVSPSEVKKRATRTVILMLLMAIISMAASGKTGWAAISDLIPFASYALGIGIGISMGRSTSGWG